MLDLEALAAWFQAQPGTPALAGPYAYNRQTHTPDAIVTLHERPGFFLELEEELDNPGVQIRVRGPRYEQLIPKALAHRYDSLLLDASLRRITLRDGTIIFAAGRSGGGPTYFDTDDQGRVTYLCNYWLTIPR